jgi:hypothetical protein
MKLLSRLGAYVTAKNVTALSDLVVRVVALVAAVGVVAFFVLRPDVRLSTYFQPFIDTSALDAAYAAQGQPTDPLARRVAITYNAENTRDLENRTNPTTAKIKVADLCGADGRLVESVFAGTDCSRQPKLIGRNRYYERLLVQEASQASSAVTAEEVEVKANELRTAINNLRESEYLRARVTLENRGLGKAVKTTIRLSHGFAPQANATNDPIVLGPRETVDRFFETTRGVEGRVLTPARPGSPAGDPVVQFGVSWDRSPNPLDDLQIRLWIGLIIIGVLFVAIVLVVLNDIRVTTQTADAPQSESQGRPRRRVTKRTRFSGSTG